MAEARKSDQFVQLYRLPPGNGTIAAVPGNDCVVALRALGEDTRVRIVGLLIHEALDVGEIARRLGVSQYNVSKHLRILREAGLLEVEKSGRTRLYGLSETIRSSATDDGVLDLGCCSFQFEETDSAPGSVSPKPLRAAGTDRKPSRRRVRARSVRT
jgi:DNA-binding transcriptional ArsR family regulator